MKRTVEMLDPETGEEFVAVYEEGKPTPFTKIVNRDVVRIARDRDDLLAALKAVIAESDRNTDPYIAARALIARIEGGK